jgi:predicted dehydrogenase
MTPFRIALVGCGGIARAHVDAFTAAGAQVAGVCDPLPAAASALAASTGATVAADALALAASGIDLAVICSPPAAHPDGCLPFLTCGIAVLCEKPLAVDGPSAAALEATARQHGTPLFVALCHRWHAPLVRLKDLLASGTIGRPLHARVQFAGRLELAGGHRADRRLAGGGVLIDNGSHAVDLIRCLLGEPRTVSATIANLAQMVAVEDFAQVHLAGDGWAAEITTGFSLPEAENYIEVHGERGRAVVSYGIPGHPQLAWWTPDGAGSDDCAGAPDRFRAQAAAVIAALRTGRPAGNAADGTAAARIIDAAYASAARGTRITL